MRASKARRWVSTPILGTFRHFRHTPGAPGQDSRKPARVPWNKSSREAPPQTAKLPADLVFPSSDADFEQATAATRGHDPPTAAARCAEVRFAMRPAVPLQSGWAGHRLPGGGAGGSDGRPPPKSGTG